MVSEPRKRLVFFLLAAYEDDSVPAMAIEKIERLRHPRIEPRLQMSLDFADDMLFVAQPQQL
jgi:hypothetical protein